jgi:hypothetical protein
MGDAGNSYGCKRRSHHSSAMDHSASFVLCPVRAGRESCRKHGYSFGLSSE